MADIESVAGDLSDAVEATAEAAEEIEEISRATRDETSLTIEAAQRAQREAEARASELSRAAMVTEHGRAIEDVRRETIECRNLVSSLTQEMANLRTQMGELSTKITELAPEPTVVLSTQQPVNRPIQPETGKRKDDVDDPPDQKRKTQVKKRFL